MEFEFIEYNPRRAARRAEAVRMNVIDDDGDEVGWLWMSEKDICNNIKDFGDHPALLKGLEAYRSPKTTHGDSNG